MERMDRNERTSDLPAGVIRDIQGLVTPYLLRAYPEPEFLYQSLAAWLRVPREWLLLSTAADGGLRLVFDAFVEPGDPVVVVSPSFAMYAVYCGVARAEMRTVQFREDLSLPLELLLDEIRPGTKLVLLAQPNQPVERVYSEAEMEALLERCDRVGALLLLDEAYHHFCPVTALPYLSHWGNLVVVRSFSKAFGIAGLRLGYLVSQPENVAQINKVRPMYEASSFAIAVGAYLLEHDHLMHDYVYQVRGSLSVLRSALEAQGFRPHGRWANSLLLPLPEELSATEVAIALKQRGFLIRADTTPPLANHLRITVGPVDQVRRFLRAFEQVLAERCLRQPAGGI